MCIMFLLSYVCMPTQQHSNPMNRIHSCEVHVYNTKETTAILVCELWKQSNHQTISLLLLRVLAVLAVLIGCSDSQLYKYSDKNI